MEWVAVDNPLEFWFKSVSRVHQGTIINWIFNCLKVTSVMFFTRSWQLRTECHSGPFRQVYFCLLGMFWPWQSESSSIKAYYPACHLPGTHWMPSCKWSPAPWARSHFARFGPWREKRTHTWDGMYWSKLLEPKYLKNPWMTMRQWMTMKSVWSMDGRIYFQIAHIPPPSLHSTSPQGLPHAVHAQNYVTPTVYHYVFFHVEQAN